MGFNFLFDKIEPTGFGLNSMALTETVGTSNLIGAIAIAPYG